MTTEHAQKCLQPSNKVYNLHLSLGKNLSLDFFLKIVVNPGL